MSRRTRSLLATSACLALLLAGCGADQPDASAGGAPGSGSHPVTVENCGAEVTFAAEPSRVVLLKSASVPFLSSLGVLDRVAARAGQYPAGYYDDETLTAIEAIPLLTDRTDTSGHLQISRETVISQEPDLVVGEVDNLSRGSLDAVGIPLLEEPALCATDPTEAGFSDIWEQMELYGRVFGQEDAAAVAIAELQDRLAAVEAEVGEPSGRSAAVLYPTVGGGVTYAYGTSSMAHPQLEAAGLTNVFEDVDERVFEVTLEELLGRDPDVLVLLYGDGDPAAVVDAVTSLPGADQLSAVRDEEIMTQLFNFTEPPTPLSVEGLERIVERFGSVA